MEEQLQQFSTINGYNLVNASKLDRAINGSSTERGSMKGGVGTASPEAVLAEYDRLGGLIKKGKYNIKIGSFYDFKNKKPFAKPEVFLSMRDLNGNVAEVPEGAPIPVEVQAVDIINDAKTAKASAKKTKAKKADDEDEE